MNLHYSLTVLLSFILSGFAFASPGPNLLSDHPPRIGIISDENTQAHADLLMIELQKTRCELVERDQINKVLNEQAISLAGLSGKDGLRVGQLIKADGLVLITSLTNGSDLVRMVAVNPGVIIWFAEFQLPKNKKKDVESWAKTVASLMSGYLQKLTVNKNEAMPLSLFRIRPAYSTRQAEQLANDLNRLLQLRLVREPALFVLERENLRCMDEEQRWSGKDSEFWAGSYVVDGAISHDLTQIKELTFTLSVLPPTLNKKSANTKSIVEKGRADELDALVERATRKLCATLGAAVTTNNWNVAQEGKLFAQMANRLPDLVQKKVALETAMALGSRDMKTASSYRGTLRDISIPRTGYSSAVMKLADKMRRIDQARDVLAYVSFQNVYRPPEGFTPESEKSWLFSYFVPLTDALDFLKLTAEDGGGDALQEWIPLIQEQCRQLTERMFRHNPQLPNGAHADSYYRYARYMYPRTGDILNLFRKGGILLTDRDKAIPVFPAGATESPVQQESLWQDYCHEQETSGPMETRYAFWRTKITLAMEQTSPTERKKLWRQIQDEILTRPELWPLLVNDAIVHWEVFPCYLKQDDGTQVTQWRGNIFDSTTPAEISETIRRGREWMMAVLKTAPTNAGSLVYNCAEGSRFPYLGSYSLSEAKEVYAATLKRDQQLVNVAATNKTDLTPLRTVLADRFPELGDKAYKTAKLASTTAQKTENDANEQLQLNALHATNMLQLPACRKSFTPQATDLPVQYVRKGWLNDKLWVRWQGDIVAFNPGTKTFDCIPEPVENPAVYPAYDVTDSCFIYWVTKRDRSHGRNLNCTLYIRSRTGGGWRSTELPYGITACAEIARTLYLVISIGVPGSYNKPGMITMNPDTLKTETLWDPNVPRQKIISKTAEIPFEALSFGTLKIKSNNDHHYDRPVLAINNELIGSCNRKNYAWDPATRRARPFSDTELTAYLNHPSQHLQDSQQFGFTIVSGVYPLNGIFALNTTRNGNTNEIVVPLVLDGFRNTNDWSYATPHGDVLTPTAIMLAISRRYDQALAGRDDFQRFYYEIPYTDIEKWLTSNMPSANTPQTSPK